MCSILLVINVDWFFLSHRKDLALAAKKNGYDVTIVANDTGRANEIKEMGLNFINLPMNRTNSNIFKDLNALLFLFKLYKKNKPSIIHHVGLKAIIIGGLAAKLTKATAVVNAVSGLGVTFSKENITSLPTTAFLKLLRYSHNKDRIRVIFQNQEDKSIFIENSIVKEKQTVFIKGSGINLEDFKYSPEPDSSKIKVILTARMIAEKGIYELVEAANSLKNEYEGKVQFLLCGGIDENPKALTEEQLNNMCDGNYIVWLGHRKDIKQLLMDSHIVAFPSYYKEGLPKSLIEASAIGRPIITTNSVGCKDVVKDGVNGFLIPVKDSNALADKLKILIENKELRVQFGKNSRLIAERDFSIENVIEKHLATYSELLS